MRYVSIQRGERVVAYVHMLENGTFCYPFAEKGQVFTIHYDLNDEESSVRRRPRDTVELLPGAYRVDVHST